jgi:hypothetical protein
MKDSTTCGTIVSLVTGKNVASELMERLTKRA